MARSDEQIKKDIVDELYWDNRIDAAKIGVTVENGIVSLGGEVPTYGDLMIVRSAVWRQAGVVDVLENLAVSYATPPLIPADAELESRANKSIVWDGVIDEANVRAVVTGGVVTLEGTVDAYWKKFYLEEKIAGIRGIHGIENRLAVVPTHKTSDEAIAKDVVKALERDVLVDAADVTVEVENGAVTLSGVVPSAAGRRAAWKDASRTAGVVSISNDLKVIP